MAEVEMAALPRVSSDAQQILKLQKKLTALNAQVHTWKARCKGLDKSNSCNFDSFMKAPASPSKRLGKSKSGANRQDWNTLSMAQQYEILHNLSHEHSQVVLDFEALSLALKTAMSSATLQKALNLEESGPEVDKDELEYLKELLEEQAERSEQILKLEERRLEHEMELLKLKGEVIRESKVMRDSYSKLMQMDPDDDVAPAYKRKALDSQAVGGLIEEKQETLKAEEDRVTEFKGMILKLMMADTKGCLNYDEQEVNEKHTKMLMKCGLPIFKLRGDTI